MSVWLKDNLGLLQLASYFCSFVFMIDINKKKFEIEDVGPFKTRFHLSDRLTLCVSWPIGAEEETTEKAEENEQVFNPKFGYVAWYRYVRWSATALRPVASFNTVADRCILTPLWSVGKDRAVYDVSWDCGTESPWTVNLWNRRCLWSGYTDITEPTVTERSVCLCTFQPCLAQLTFHWCVSCFSSSPLVSILFRPLPKSLFAEAWNWLEKSNR